MNFISKYDQHKDMMRTCIQRFLHLLVRRTVALTFALCGLCVEQTVHCVCGCVHLSPSDAANNEWVVPFTCDNFSIVLPLVGVLNSNLSAGLLIGFLMWRCAISVCAFMFSKGALCRNAGTYTWQWSSHAPPTELSYGSVRHSGSKAACMFENVAWASCCVGGRRYRPR